MAAIQERAVDQAIKIASCGSVELARRLQEMKPAIAALVCVGPNVTTCRNPFELFLLARIEVLKIAIVQAAQLIDFTEAREDVSREMKQTSIANKDSRATEERERHIDIEMRFCSYRKWNRHRTADDQSDSLAKAKSRANSYSFYRDISRQRSANYREKIGLSSGHDSVESQATGEGRGSRDDKSLSFIKPRQDGGGDGAYPPLTPVDPALDATAQTCAAIDTTSITNWLLSGPDIFRCVGAIISGTIGSVGTQAYDTDYIGSASKYIEKTPITDTLVIGGGHLSRMCLSLNGEDPCSADGSASVTGDITALGSTFSNGYSGQRKVNFSFSVAGTGWDISWSMSGGESFSQTAKLDRAYDYARMRDASCSNSGGISNTRNLQDDYAEGKTGRRNYRYRNAEKASQAASSLTATSTGTMRFSGQSSSGSDRTYVKKMGSTMIRQASSEEHSSAKLADVSNMKMKSITEFRHQIAKMLNDLLSKAMQEWKDHKYSYARRATPQSSSVPLKDWCDTPLGRISQGYLNPIRRTRYPLQGVAGYSDLIRIKSGG